MAKRFTGGTFSPAQVSQEQLAGAQAQVAAGQPTIAPSVELPSEQLLAGGAQPSAAPTVQPSSPASPSGITSLADAIFANQQSAQRKAEQPQQFSFDPEARATGIQDPRSLELPTSAGEASPAQADVLSVPVPVAGQQAGLGIVEDPQQKQDRYLDEQQKQAKLSSSKVFDMISGLGTESEQAFNSAAADVGVRLEREAQANPRIAQALTQAGIIDQSTGIVDGAATRTMLFTMASKAAQVESEKSDSVAELQQQVLSGEVKETELDDKIRHAVLKPDFDRQNLQSSFAGDFQRLFGGEQGIDPATLRVDDPAAGASLLAPADKSLLAVSMGKILQDMGFVEGVIREDNGRKRAGYNIKDDFIGLMSEIAPVLEEFNTAFKRGVSFTPNIGGVPSGQSSLLHSQATRAPKNQKAKKGSEVWQAMNAMGTTAFGVNTMNLGNNAVILESILDPKWMSQGGGFSRHPLAEHFLLGSGTFMRFFKDDEIATLDDLNRVYKETQARANSGFDRTAATRLEELNQKVQEAKTIQGFVAKSYIKAFVEGTQLNGKSFYHTQTLIAGNSRVMVGSTEFNYQANKKARGLTSNPQMWLVDPNNKGSKANRAFRLMVARNLVHDADRAPSSKRLLELFETDIMGNPEMIELAKWLDSSIGLQTNQVNTYAQNVANYKTTTSQDHPRPSDVLPHLDSNFPSIGIKLPDNEQRLNQLAKVMEVIDPKSGQPKKSDEGDFKLQALRELGRYLNGRPFQTQLTSEADGIANGLIIQGYQFGAREVLQRGGVLYDNDRNLTPLGDMRDFIQSVIVDGDKTDAGGITAINQVFAEKSEAKKWTGAYAELIGNSPGLTKALHKLPAMTTPYGLDPDFHHGSITKFLNDNGQASKQLQKQLGVSEKELVDKMAMIEGAALRLGLGGVIQHQAIVKNAYNAAIAGGELFEVEGPNGWNIISGGVDYEAISDEDIQFSDGSVARVLTQKRVGTPYAAAAAKSDDHITKLGSKGKNQSAVFGTQNIDATVAQRAYVNTKADLDKSSFWAGQVYDAVIGDIGSFEALVDNINREFKNVNRNYNMVQAELDAVQQIRQKVRKKVAEAKKHGLKFDVSETGEYKGMFYILKKLKSEQSKASKATGGRSSALQQRLAKRAAQGSNIGFRFDGSQMTPDQFMNAWEHVIKTLQIEESLRAFKSQVDKKKAELEKEIKQQEAAGRLVGQYR